MAEGPEERPGSLAAPVTPIEPGRAHQAPVWWGGIKGVLNPTRAVGSVSAIPQPRLRVKRIFTTALPTATVWEA
jgi:hypothetical protein